MPERQDNFDTLRFGAAFAVLLSHSFSLSEGTEENEPLIIISGSQTTLGAVAVAVFFVISGFLVSHSFHRSPNLWRFAKARVLRLMPALIVVLLLLAVAVGPALTTVPLATYFQSADFFLFLLNATFVVFHDRLPGVFTENPLPYINGPLWTLGFEAECYGLIFVLGALGLLNRYTTLAWFAAGMLYLAIENQNDMIEYARRNHHVDLATKFLAGAVLYHWRPPLNGLVAAACLAVSLVMLVVGGFWIALTTLVPYVVLYTALGLPVQLPKLARYGDLSYGIYIYGWPVEQLMVMSQSEPVWYVTAALATPIVLGLAFLSWHLVERPALSFKDRTHRLERPLIRLFAAGQRSARALTRRVVGFLT